MNSRIRYARSIFVDLGEKPILPPFALGPDHLTIRGGYRVADSVQTSDSCTIEILSACDPFCHFRFSRYTVHKEIKLFSVPNRAVLTLNIQLTGNIDFVFGEHQTGMSREDECQLFWQGDQTVVQHLLPGEYCTLDIFFEDNMVPKLKIDGEKIHFWKAGLPDTPLSTDFHSARLTEETKVHVRDIAERIRTHSFSGDEFFLACMTLLTYYFKGKKKNSRPSIERMLYTFPFNRFEKDCYPRSEEYYYKIHLEKMRGLDRSRLEERFLYLWGKVVPKLDHFDWATSMIYTVLDHYLLRPEPEQIDALLDFHYGTAKLLADRINSVPMSVKDRDWVRLCIFALFSSALEIAKPTGSQTDFLRSFGLLGYKEGMSDMIYQELMKNREGALESTEYSKPNILQHGSSSETDRIAEAKVCPIRSADTVSVYARLCQGLEKYSVLFRKGWHKIQCEINRAYIEDDHHALLLLEIRYLSKLPGYLDRIDTETLCWYQIVLKTELNEMRNADPDIVRFPAYPLLRLHGMLEEWQLSKFMGLRARTATMDQVLENIKCIRDKVLLSGSRDLLYSFCGMVSRSYWN